MDESAAPIAAIVPLVHFSTLDLMVMGVPLVIVFVVALMMRRYLRSVADFLAASRCAGRYVMCVSAAEIGAGVAGLVGGWEVFQTTGFAIGFWSGYVGFIYFLLALTAVVGYRFRETRCLTFHQFFEVRYSKGLRVFSSFLNVFSGLFTFGIVPGVSAKFFVYFLGLDPSVTFLGITVPTFAVIMFFLLLFSLFFALSGGQISVMVTDCVEGVVSNIFYLVVAFALFTTISYSQMLYAFTNSVPAGKSLVNPFDIGGQQDFNYWYVILGLFSTLYFWRGGAWNAGFTAAGKSAHESKMAGIIGVWRGMAAGAMGFLIGAGAVMLLRHPDYADKAAQINGYLATLPTEQWQRMMRIPTALGLLLPSGARGALCAITLFGTLAGLGNSMQNFGSVLVQDVILPFRRRALNPQWHIFWLRASMVLVGAFAFFVSWVWTPPDYLQLALAVISSLYLGGIGAVVWGGLYWRRSTSQGAWTAMIVGSGLSVLAWFLQTFWNKPPTTTGTGAETVTTVHFSLNQFLVDRWGALPQPEFATLVIGWGVIVVGLALAALAIHLIMRDWRKGVMPQVWVGSVVVAAMISAGIYGVSSPSAASGTLRSVLDQLTGMRIGLCAAAALALVLGQFLIGLFTGDAKWHRRGGVTLVVLILVSVLGAVARAVVVQLGLTFVTEAGGVPTVSEYLNLLDHWTRFPINGQYLSVFSMFFAGSSFIVVSLLTSREPYDLDRMLHRGKYALKDEDAPLRPVVVGGRRTLSSLIGINEYYTRGDKILHLFTFWWGLWPNAVGIVIIVWNVILFYGIKIGKFTLYQGTGHFWPDNWWWAWWAVTGLFIPLLGGVITTIWFTWGTTRDLFRLMKALPTMAVNDADDGMVRDHHNAGESDAKEIAAEEDDGGDKK
jgi:SSS family solute:Na+ symporter